MKTPNCLQTEKGFSLVEMIVVIAIVGIVSVFAVYSWQGYRNNTNLRTAARDIVTDIAATRQKTVAEEVRYRITFDTSAKNYIIEKGTAAGAPYVTVDTKNPNTVGGGAGLSITSVNFSGTPKIEFYSRGTLSAGRVVLKNSKGSQATITVNLAGRTHVQFVMQ